MNALLKNVLAVSALAMATHAAAQVTFYEREGFEGRSFTTETQIGNLDQFGFNDRASSVVVFRGRWEVCENARFGGRCVVLRPGRYPSLAAMGLSDSVSSVRTVSRNARLDDNRYAPAPAAPQITFYEREGFQGRSLTTDKQIGSFERVDFNDRAASVVVLREFWEACEDAWFGGRCVVLRPGRYPSLTAMGLSDSISSVRIVNANERVEDNRYAPIPAVAQVTFYEREGYQGRSFVTREQVDNLERYGFNDRASSAVVVGESREVCEDIRFSGRCVVLRPGRYPSLAAIGLNDRISSVRAVAANARGEDNRYLPAPAVPAPVAYGDYRRRDDEQLYEARVTSVRAVVGTPEQRCWVEREQVVQDQNANVPGAIAGALIGGILGHQIGGGRGKDAATVGGAIAGAALGANVGRDSGGQPAYTQNVQRCDSVSSQVRAEYWDVTYVFRGVEHRLQMTTPPGSTITVNGLGEPRA